MYSLFHNLFLKFTESNPELAHDVVIHLLKQIDNITRATDKNYILNLLDSQFVFNDSRLVQHCLGLTFPNILGLAAGCDKNAEATAMWQHLGFGFVEVGTVTMYAQEGNSKPRMHRLPDLQSLINNMGLNNDGLFNVLDRLRETRNHYKQLVPVGLNISDPDLMKWIDTYYNRTLYDYIVINMSCPNVKQYI